MGLAGFLELPHQNNISLNIVSWNINGARTKLEKSAVYDFLSNFDIISLNEVKTPISIFVAGYVPYRSKSCSGAASRRGGTIVLVKNYLASQIYDVDTNVIDQVWLRIRCVPGVMFAFCYVPPSDSTYFNHQSFATLNKKMSDLKENTTFFIVGDMNARFGASVQNIPLKSSIPSI